MRKSLLTLLALAAVAVSPLHAQRTAKGERFLLLSGDYMLVNGYGGTAAFGVYTMNGFWEGAADVTFQGYTIGAEPARSGRYLACAGYMVRLASSRNRSVNLYGGGGVLMGAGTMSASDMGWTALNESAGTEWFTDQTYFLYGVYPKVEMEAFLSENLAFDIAVRAPLNIFPTTYSALQSVIGLVHCQVSAGFKYNF